MEQTSKEIRAKLTQLLKAGGKEPLFSRQVNTENNIFPEHIVKDTSVLPPPYDPKRMISICESSSLVPPCVDAMVRNIDGFGYELKFIGDVGEEKSTEALSEKKVIEGFFNQINEKESFTTVRKQVREDVERIGYGFMEVIRANDQSLSLIYWADAQYIRLQKRQINPHEITVDLTRDGKVIPVTIKICFRRFVMHDPSRIQVKYFKEYGDPRRMCAITGKYESELSPNETIEEEATEILHVKIGNDTYGVPRWSGHVSTVLGVTSADYVNQDLFENQVVPPLAVLVSGGKLTRDSAEDILEVLGKKKGIKNFNKVLIIEAESDGGVDEKDKTKVELKELSQARKEDAMFTNYIEQAETRVRCAFRLSALYLGKSGEYSKSTADSAKMVAEEQVFVPLRMEFDELINNTLMRDLKATYWSYASKSPRLITGEDVLKAIDIFAKIGVVSINDVIKLANNILGRDIQEYKHGWADYPIAIVLELAKKGMLNQLDEIVKLSDNVIEDLETVPDTDTDDDSEKSMQLAEALIDVRKSLVSYRKYRTDRE